MRLVFLSLFALNLFAEDFISFQEYAKMLYENPRGISCKECHGEDGSAQTLGYFTHKGERKPFIVPSIQNLSFESFLKSLKEIKDAKSIMPTYSLTDEEIKVLYTYLETLREEKK